MAMTTTKMRFCAGRGGKNVILGESIEREKKSLRSVQRKSRELTSFLEIFCPPLHWLWGAFISRSKLLFVFSILQWFYSVKKEPKRSSKLPLELRTQTMKRSLVPIKNTNRSLPQLMNAPEERFCWNGPVGTAKGDMTEVCPGRSCQFSLFLWFRYSDSCDPTWVVRWRRRSRRQCQSRGRCKHISYKTRFAPWRRHHLEFTSDWPYIQGVPSARRHGLGWLIWVFHRLAWLPSGFCHIPINPGRIGQTVEHSKSKSS